MIRGNISTRVIKQQRRYQTVSYDKAQGATFYLGRLVPPEICKYIDTLNLFEGTLASTVIITKYEYQS